MDNDDDAISIPKPAERYFKIWGIELRKITELEPIEIAFLAFAMASVIAALGMTAYRIKTSSTNSTDFIFAILLLVNLLFVFYYIFDGIFMERPFEILVSVLTVIIVLVYCIADYSINTERRTVLKKVRLAVVCLVGPIDIGLGIAVAVKFFEGPGNLMFRLVGANLQLQKICRNYFIFTAFLGFDFQIVLILLVLLMSDKPSRLVNSEKCIIGIGVPLSALAIVIGRLGARMESMVMACVFLSFCVAEPAYIIYLFVKFGTKLERANKHSTEDKEKILYSCVVAAGVVGLIVRIILVLMAGIVIRNFGKGLKNKLYPSESVEAPGNAYQRHTDNR